MPIKYFCDECEVEVSDPSTSLDMTGKILCTKHYHEHQSANIHHQWNYTKSWDKDRFKLPKGIRRVEDIPPICLHPQHNPPSHIVLKPGFHEYICPACGKSIQFTVHQVTL